MWEFPHSLGKSSPAGRERVRVKRIAAPRPNPLPRSLSRRELVAPFPQAGGAGNHIDVDAQTRARKLGTVDGDTMLSRWAQATALRSVDGDIAMATGAACSGGVRGVDGSIRLVEGARVAAMSKH